MRVWRADLHVHTCLSPCADLSMAPRTIVAAALARGLDAIGVADHNSAGNIPAVVGAARQTRLAVLPAMEITSREEVHILAIFGDVEAARAAGARGVLVPTEKTRPEEIEAAPEVAASLGEAVDRLLGEAR